MWRRVSSSVLPDGKQRLLSPALQSMRIRASSPTLVTQGQPFHLPQVAMGGGLKGIFPSPMPAQDRLVGSWVSSLAFTPSGLTHLCPSPQGQLHCDSRVRGGVIFPKCGVEFSPEGWGLPVTIPTKGQVIPGPVKGGPDSPTLAGLELTTRLG